MAAVTLTLTGGPRDGGAGVDLFDARTADGEEVVVAAADWPGGGQHEVGDTVYGTPTNQTFNTVKVDYMVRPRT